MTLRVMDGAIKFETVHPTATGRQPVGFNIGRSGGQLGEKRPLKRRGGAGGVDGIEMEPRPVITFWWTAEVYGKSILARKHRMECIVDQSSG